MPNKINDATNPNELGKNEGKELNGSESIIAIPIARTTIPAFANQNCPISNSIEVCCSSVIFSVFLIS